MRVEIDNHPESLGAVSPMVFLGGDWWTRVAPAYPLLRTLAVAQRHEDMPAAVDDAGAALRFPLEHPPVPCRPPEVGGG